MSHHATTCPLTPSLPPFSKPSRATSCHSSPPSSTLISLQALFQHPSRLLVKPLLKKPTVDTALNYRPVSLLSFLSKTLEHAISNQLSSYLSHNLLDPHQSGFKAAHSTETALLAVTESLRAARASSLSSVLILLNLSAAFDTVNHQILLATLAELGIADSALPWFTSYLTNRTYQVT